MTSGPGNPWLPWAAEDGTAKLRLFCFPFAGGGASFFYPWRADASPGIEICPVQPPGREARLSEPALRNIRDLTSAIADALGPHLEQPFAFFGHSLGALIAFETARELRRTGSGNPCYLFVSAKRAPQAPNPHPPIFDLPEERFLEEVRRWYAPSEAAWQDPELRALLLPILRADMAVSDLYVHRPEDPLDCPIYALGGAADSSTSHDTIERWREQTTSGFRMRMFDGGHFFLAEARQEVQRLIAKELQEKV